MSKTERISSLESRVSDLERWSHEPFDFTDLIERLERLEGRSTTPDVPTPLDSALGKRLIAVVQEGSRARESGDVSPYPGNSLEHCLHATGWVQRDLRLALDKSLAGDTRTGLQEALSVLAERRVRLASIVPGKDAVLSELDKIMVILQARISE